jgi:hypothetical protein
MNQQENTNAPKANATPLNCMVDRPFADWALYYKEMRLIEDWADVKNYEGVYQVSSLGRVRSLDRIDATNGNHRILKGRVLRPGLNGNKYLHVILYDRGSKKGIRVHKLVALAFIPNPMGFSEINHKDGIKTNNVVTNLEWCNRSYNMNHAVSMGLFGGGKGENHGMAKLSNSDVLFIRKNPDMPVIDVALLFKITKTNVRNIKNNKTWKNIVIEH